MIICSFYAVVSISWLKILPLAFKLMKRFIINVDVSRGISDHTRRTASWPVDFTVLSHCQVPTQLQRQFFSLAAVIKKHCVKLPQSILYGLLRTSHLFLYICVFSFTSAIKLFEYSSFSFKPFVCTIVDQRRPDVKRVWRWRRKNKELPYIEWNGLCRKTWCVGRRDLHLGNNLSNRRILNTHWLHRRFCVEASFHHWHPTFSTLDNDEHVGFTARDYCCVIRRIFLYISRVFIH